jgi:hypothetical protein
MTFLAVRDDRTNRWTGFAYIGSKCIAQTPEDFPTKRAALAAIRSRV